VDLELAVVRSENTQLRRQLEQLGMEHFTMGNQLVALTRLVATMVHSQRPDGGDPNERYVSPEELRAAEDACLFRFSAEPVVVEGEQVYGIRVRLQPATAEDTEKLRAARAATHKPRIEIATG
jgi:hypothetical protein